MTDDFTGMFTRSIYLSFKVCTGRISHLDQFKVKPEALEKLLMKEIAWGIKDMFFKNKVESSANWDILSTLSKMLRPWISSLLTISINNN